MHGIVDYRHSFAFGEFVFIDGLSSHSKEGGESMTFTNASFAIAFVISSFCYWLIIPFLD